MLSMNRRRKPIATEKQGGTSPLPMPGIVDQYSPVVQQSFPEGSSGLNEVRQNFQPMPQYAFPASSALVKGVGMEPEAGASSSVAENRQLIQVKTGPLAVVPASDTTSVREPVVIRGTGKKSTGTMLPPKPKGKRLFLHSAVSVILVFMVAGALFAVLPVGAGHASGFDIFNSVISMVNAKNTNTGLIVAQAATATAVTQDGYDPGSKVYAGVASGPAVTANTNYGNSGGNSSASDAGGLGRFFYGQCTYWANMRYHQLTGHWVSWLGNAGQWTYGAASSGWVVSNTPNPNGPSIIVLQAYTQGAGWYGHVAVVEGGTASNVVPTSNWNWAGNWGTETWVTFSTGPGVKFVWFPG